MAELWRDHETLARTVARDVIDIQEQLTGKHFDSAALITGMLEAFDGDPQHACMGRSALARLCGALEEADPAELAVPKLRAITTKDTKDTKKNPANAKPIVLTCSS